MKPERAEHLVITMHNQTDDPIKIDIGDKIAVLMFYELTTKYESTQTEKELNSVIDVFLNDCLDSDSGDILNELRNLREDYNRSKIINEMKTGNSQNDFEIFVKGNNFKVKFERNILLTISAIFFVIQFVLLLLGKIRVLPITEVILEFLAITTPITSTICIPLLVKKFGE
jgi:hypothetical protein